MMWPCPGWCNSLCSRDSLSGLQVSIATTSLTTCKLLRKEGTLAYPWWVHIFLRGRHVGLPSHRSWGCRDLLWVIRCTHLLSDSSPSEPQVSQASGVWMRMCERVRRLREAVKKILGYVSVDEKHRWRKSTTLFFCSLCQVCITDWVAVWVDGELVG